MHNSYTNVEFDPAKARANLTKHKVSFAQAEEALSDPMAITMIDSDALDEQRLITLGGEAEQYHAQRV